MKIFDYIDSNFFDEIISLSERILHKKEKYSKKNCRFIHALHIAPEMRKWLMQVFMHYTTWKRLKYYYLKNLVFMLCSTNKWKSFPFSAWLYIYMIPCSLRSFEWHMIKMRRLSCIIKIFIFLRSSVIKNQCILTILKC